MFTAVASGPNARLAHQTAYETANKLTMTFHGADLRKDIGEQAILMM